MLPQGTISMPIVNPLPGLVRWCVLAPISTIPTNSDKVAYSKLHLAILQILMHDKSESVNDLPPASTINSISLGVIIYALKFKAMEISKVVGSRGSQVGQPDTDEQMQLSLDRLAQCIQIAIHSRSMSSNVFQIFSRLKTLPKNKLLDIVIKTQEKLNEKEKMLN